MDTSRVVHGGAERFAAREVDHGGFGYVKRVVWPKEDSQLQVSFMEIPPGRTAFPTHWHAGITEVYVIVAGRGRVRVADDEFDVAAGEVVVFPPGPAGTHRMTNIGAEPLRYVDLDTTADPDVVHYPDSGKTAVWTATDGLHAWQDADEVDYYAGEADALA